MICYKKCIRLNLRLETGKERIGDLEERLKKYTS